LGVNIKQGEISFSPALLMLSEFLSEPANWQYSTGGDKKSENLEAGSLAFTLCGVPIIYHLAEDSGIQVYSDQDSPAHITGNQLGLALSQSIFRREKRIKKVVVKLPAGKLRHQ
jgi:hypothetical protein